MKLILDPIKVEKCMIVQFIFKK